MRRLLKQSKHTESFEEMQKSEDMNNSIPVIDVSKISNDDSKKKCEGSVSHHSADLGKEAEVTETQWQTLLSNARGGAQTDQFEKENRDLSKLHSFYEEEEEDNKKQWETYEVESAGDSSQKGAAVEEDGSAKKEVDRIALEEIQEVNSSPEQIVSAPVKESLPEVEKVVEEKSSAPVVEKKAMAPHPRKMPNVSPFAQGIIDQLELAVAEKDGNELSNQVFDAECEGLEDQIDLQWYEHKAAELIENS